MRASGGRTIGAMWSSNSCPAPTSLRVRKQTLSKISAFQQVCEPRLRSHFVTSVHRVVTPRPAGGSDIGRRKQSADMFDSVRSSLEILRVLLRSTQNYNRFVTECETQYMLQSKEGCTSHESTAGIRHRPVNVTRTNIDIRHHRQKAAM